MMQCRSAGYCFADSLIYLPFDELMPMRVYFRLVSRVKLKVRLSSIHS